MYDVPSLCADSKARVIETGLTMGATSIVYGVVLVLVMCPATKAQNKTAASHSLQIMVFRHHPGIMDSPKKMRAKTRDEAAIFRMLARKRISFSYSGGLGSGFELMIYTNDLRRWKVAVDTLIRHHKLFYYSGWDLDKHGYGLVPIH